MITTIFYILCGLVVLFILYQILQNLKVSQFYLYVSSIILVALLPFQRIPSIELGGGTLRPGQIVAGLSGLLIVYLLFSFQKDFYNKKFHKINILFLLFFAFQIPNLYLIINYERFIVSFGATVLAFLTAFIIANFSKINRAMVWTISLSSIFLMAFSIYQIIFDTLGFPMSITFINVIHGAHVFGVTRAHGTFIEPSYFANAVFFYAGFWFILYVKNYNIFSALKFEKNKKLVLIQDYLSKNYKKLYLIFFLTFIFLQVISIAKSAWLIMPFAYLGLILVYHKKLLGIYKNNKKLINKIISYGSIVLIIGLAYLSTTPFIDSVASNVIQTINGRTATFIERDGLLKSAIEIMPDNYLFGTGSGQFGTVAKNNILNNLGRFSQKHDHARLIVFNVYAEVLVENGISAFLSYLALIGFALIKGIDILKRKIITKPQEIVITSSLFYILCSLVQFWFISPIYIYPFFIVLGLALSVIFKYE